MLNFLKMYIKFEELLFKKAAIFIISMNSLIFGNLVSKALTSLLMKQKASKGKSVKLMCPPKKRINPCKVGQICVQAAVAVPPGIRQVDCIIHRKMSRANQ